LSWAISKSGTTSSRLFSGGVSLNLTPREFELFRRLVEPRRQLEREPIYNVPTAHGGERWYASPVRAILNR